MKSSRSTLPFSPVARILLGLTFAGFAAASFAQGFPTKPMRTFVGFPTGNTVDLLARMIGGKLSESLGQPMIVENRLGAGGALAAEPVARAAPDGHTLMFATPSTHVTNLLLSKNVSFDPFKDFTPIAPVGEAVLCIVVSASLPVKNVGELVEHARRAPGKLSYGSIGTGGTFHFVGEAFKAASGTDILHVPYKGTGPVLTDMAGGLIQVGFLNLATSMPFIKAGKVRLLAVIGSQRYATVPDVPSTAEAMPAFQAPTAWFGYFGPAGMPAPLVRRLNAEISKALAASDMAGKFEQFALRATPGSPEDMASLHKSSLAAYTTAARAAGLKPE
jgi:tripartite-type tricarboxylate transporter receptor subunit TctC